ncbi:N-(5'-phospho-L-ribosyl-formimino)-5-amino-1-(5'-phosphoribosyl)-4-imidazolecarboxamide isomerase [Erysipelotrichaceae bacterium]|nr:N-(5'-phospho-L-ribosyl-formimino)-5-amino-1-(5'-phosphoribosyl)-4-imidazolecarboxamide isomerase [Erysipelotrichaceae bacterium]
MIIYPAIDLKDGVCVRLMQGDFEAMTVFHQNPVEQAVAYEKKGATYIHLVDLDGAKDGVAGNTAVIAEIIKHITIPIQVGGGIRDEKKIKELLDLGVARVILGTKAIENIAFVTEMVLAYPDKIIVSIDAKNGYVATKGWVEQTDVRAADLCKQLKQIGVQTIVYTDIGKDGMMSGIEDDFYAKLKQNLGIEIIASGGVTSLVDVRNLAQKGIDGAIIGKALYIEKINLEEAIIVAQEERKNAE